MERGSAANVQPGVAPMHGRALHAGQQALDDMLDIGHITAKLLACPDTIRRQQNAVQAARGAVAEAEAEVQLAGSILQMEIDMEKDPKTGKKAFSNDTLRKAELTRRQTKSPEYQDALSKLKDAENVLNSAQFDLDKVVNEFSAWRSVGELVGGRFRLMAGLS